MNNILTSYRPKNLVEFVCTSDMKMKLLRVLENPQKYKTYLLSGPSGIGKTTFARIVSNNLGWADNKVEYIELNCADTRGIDFARDLLPILGIRPLMHDYKVIVLDEAHMITSQAQNTLLKGFEDVPENNYVILCSTNPDSLIDTIRNRCYEIDLTPSSLDDIGLKASLKKYGQLVGRENDAKKFVEDSSFMDTVINSFLDKNIPEHLSIRQFTVYLSDILDRLKSNPDVGIEEAAQLTINSSVDKYDPILVARWLLKQNNPKGFNEDHWKQVAERVNNLNCTIESARLMFLSYFSKVLISTNDIGERILCTNIIKTMHFDGTGTDAKSKLLIAFRDMFDRKGGMSSKNE